jgi:hypothetical protein
VVWLCGELSTPLETVKPVRRTLVNLYSALYKPPAVRLKTSAVVPLVALTSTVGKIKNRRRTADNFKIFLFCLQFLIKFNKTAVLLRNQKNMSDICGNKLGNRPRGYPCFLLAGDTLGNAPSWSPLLFGHFPKCICYLVQVAEKISNTLWAFPKELTILFGYFSNGLNELLETFPSEFLHNLGISFTFPSKQHVSVN